MKKRKVKFKYKKKTFSINTLECNALEKIRGLTFRTRKKSRALLFDFQNNPKVPAIHSYFVFFPFVAVWLDKDNKVIDIKRVRPFTLRVYPKKPYGKLIEIPINNRYRKIISQIGLWKKRN